MRKLGIFLTMDEAMDYIHRYGIDGIITKELDGRFHVYMMDKRR